MRIDRIRHRTVFVLLAALAIWIAGSGCDGALGGALLDVEPDLTPLLSGTVTDAVTHAPVSGALVVLERQSTETNDSGQYWLYDLEPGRYVVSVDHAEYAQAEKVAEIGTSVVNLLDFELQPLR